MGKNKPRHNPDKPQNKYGKYCQRYEEHNNFACCERGWDVTKRKGNPHNCIKVEYQILASRSDKQKNEGVGVAHRYYLELRWSDGFIERIYTISIGQSS